MRVALVHDWLIGMRGGERVLEQFALMWPDAEIFTLLYEPHGVSPAIREHRVHVSALGRLPAAERFYRYALPFMPGLIERFDLRGFDLVLSSSHCVAHGVRVPHGLPHVCYCHTPMRYLYDQSAAYARSFSAGTRGLFQLVRPRLERWDRASAQRVTRFIANSQHVQARISRRYDRIASVICPPVDVSRFTHLNRRDDYYVTVSALVPYKRIDLIVRAFNVLGRRLVIIGSGPQQRMLEQIANSNIEFTGWLPDAEVTERIAGARGFVYAAVEDFGIALVEAQAAGTPVITFGAGGALETVLPGETGLLFDRQTADALIEAITEFEQRSFDPATLRRNALRFRPERFRESVQSEVDSVMSGAVAMAR